MGHCHSYGNQDSNYYSHQQVQSEVLIRTCGYSYDFRYRPKANCPQISSLHFQVDWENPAGISREVAQEDREYDFDPRTDTKIVLSGAAFERHRYCENFPEWSRFVVAMRTHQSVGTYDSSKGCWRLRMLLKSGICRFAHDRL